MLRKKIPERYLNLSHERKNKKGKCGCERYKSLPAEEKIKIVKMLVEDIEVIQKMKNKS